MKDEKLKSMLNKVVEYNDPNAHGGRGHNFKAFLYKNYRGYYFKVVEIITGTDVAFNDIIYLEDGDEKFLVVADKPKLMRISKKSWHYKLLQFVLRDNAPTPHDMQNGCPYFWLVMFSILVVPFVVLYKAIKEVVLFVPKILFWILKQLVKAWIAGLDDTAAYELKENGRYGQTKLPKTAKMFFDESNEDFFSLFMAEKYDVEDRNDPKFAEKQAEMREKWRAWREDLDKRRTEQRIINDKKEREAKERKAIQAKRRRKAEAEWEELMQPWRTWRKETAATLRSTFTVERGRRNSIVKRTKQFVGGVVTLIILTATFFVVNYISLGLMVIMDGVVDGGWKIFLGLAVAAAVGGILYLLYILISSWGQDVVNKYNAGKKVWYIEPVIYLVWIPIKYIAVAIAYVFVNIIWAFLKFVFYTVIFRYFLKPVGLFIGRGFVSLAKGLVGSTGIFGEYFGASYSDFCPGLEWVDFDED